MSKNSNEKQLNTRLNNLFNDLDQPKVFPGLEVTSDLTGWIWEMDPTGLLTGCSPEIESFLQIPAHQVIGTNIDTFTDFDFKSANLPNDPNQAMMPTAVPIRFRGHDGNDILTETFFMAKLGEDGSILNWRGISSVPQTDLSETDLQEEKLAEKKDPFGGLAALDIVPEIPQPDMSVSDIWRKSTMDTAPLSPEELLEESEAFQASLQKQYEWSTDQKDETSHPDDLKTFIVNRESSFEEAQSVGLAQSAEISEEGFRTEELETNHMEDIPVAGISETKAVKPQLFEEDLESSIEADLVADEKPEPESTQAAVFSPEIDLSTTAGATVTETAEIEQAHESYGESELSEPSFSETADSESIDAPIDHDFAYPDQPPAEVSEPLNLTDAVEIPPTEQFEVESTPGVVPQEEPTPTSVGEPEIPQGPYSFDPKILEAFAPFDRAASFEQTESYQAEFQKDTAARIVTSGIGDYLDDTDDSLPILETGSKEAPPAFESIAPDQPRENEPDPQDEIETIRYTNYPVEQIAATNQVDLVGAEPAETNEVDPWQTSELENESEAIADQLSPIEETSLEEEILPIEAEDHFLQSEAAHSPQTESSSGSPSDWVPEFHRTPHVEPETLEPTLFEEKYAAPQDKTEPLPYLNVGPVIPEDQPQFEPDVEAPKVLSFSELEAEIFPELASQEMAGVEPPADTKELNMKPPRSYYDLTVSEEEPVMSKMEEESRERMQPPQFLADLDIDQDQEMDTVTLDPFPQKPVTGSGRRPLIDTGSLIPSLIRARETSQHDQESKLSLDDFLTEPEDDTLRIETKELDLNTSGDGAGLTISRGVQELLKIVDNNPNRVWKEDELRLVEQVHNQLELALENANLFQQTQLALAETDERARQLRLLNQMSEQINQTDDLLEIYDIVAHKARDIFRVERASITTISQDRKMLEIVASAGSNPGVLIGTTIPIENSPNEVVIRENRVYIPRRPVEEGEEVIKSTMAGPINISNTVIGTLNVGTSQPNAFNDRDANLLTQVLSILNASVENRRLFEQIESALSATEEQARRLSELNRLSELFSTATSIDEVISLIVENLQRIISSDYWAYASVSQQYGTYTMHFAQDRKNDLPIVNGQPISTSQPLDGSIINKAAIDRRSIIEFNCVDSQYQDVRMWSAHKGIRTAMSTPLIAANKVIGVITVSSLQLSAYTVQEENIMQSIASLAGSTIDNRQLLTQIQKRSQQLETSAEVSRVASTILDPTELLPKVANLIKNGFNLYYAGIFLVDESGEFTGKPGKWAVLRAGSGDAGSQMVAAGHKLEIGGESMIGTAISTSQARIALNVGEEASFFRNPYLPETRSEMALPLTSRGHVLGALTIQSENRDAFSQEDITALQTMADQLANSIENARLFEQTELRAEELTVLNEMARGFTQSMFIDDLVKNTYEFAGRLMDATNFYLVLYYPNEEFFECRLFVEAGQIVHPPVRRMRLGNGLTDWIIKNKLPVLMPGDTEAQISSLGVDIPDRLPKSWLGVPMLLGNEVTGVIAVQNYVHENTYNNHSLDLLIAVASQAAVAIDNARRFQATQTRARHEEILRRVTTQVHSTSDPDAILRTAVREVSDALGKPAFVKLAPEEHTDVRRIERGPLQDNNPGPQPEPPAIIPQPGRPEEM